jgi:threonyl-tRNA synthetase
LRNEKIGFKIREHTLQKVPYLLVVGDREVEQQALAVRDRKGKDLGTFSLEDFVAKLSEEVANRAN